jgi:spermidine synthase
VTWVALVSLVGLLVVLLAATLWEEAWEARVMRRSFYGRLRVLEREASGTSPAMKELMHGTISHGLQLQAAEGRRQPTSYYGYESGVGRALRAMAARPNLRVGIIGLGPGTLAAYGRAGDRFTFYEINPQVVELAEAEFTFLRDSEAASEVVLGDARLSLERAPSQDFDLLAVDAFSSGAIPMHLLTREAFGLYSRHLRPSGVLAVHISNRYVDLEPVVAGAAEALGRQAVLVVGEEDKAAGVYRSHWVLVSDWAEFFVEPALQQAARPVRRRDDLRLWTDDYSTLLPILK